MIRTLDIVCKVELADAPFHHLHWLSRLELALDCFICERVGRTTKFEVGAERAVCSGDRAAGPHFTAARVTGFDNGETKTSMTLNAVVSRWFAPFQDAKRDQPGMAVPRGSWVRLYLGYSCPDGNLAGEFSVQSNLVRPHTSSCQHCQVPLIRDEHVPRVTER